MKITRFYAVIQFVIILSACQSCTSYKTDTDIDFESVLTESVFDTIEFCFSELIGPSSEAFMIIPPYTYLDRLSDSVGIDFMKLANTGIEIRDDASVLALLENGILSDFYLLNYQRVTLSGLEDIIKYDIKTPLILRRSDSRYIIELR